MRKLIPKLGSVSKSVMVLECRIAFCWTEPVVQRVCCGCSAGDSLGGFRSSLMLMHELVLVLCLILWLLQWQVCW